MSDKCLSLNAKELQSVADDYLALLSGDPVRRLHILTSAGISGSGLDAVKQFCELVIRYMNDKDGNTDSIVMPKGAKQMDKWVEAYLDQSQRDNDIRTKGRAGSVVIGNGSVGNTELVGVLDKQVSVTHFVKKEGSTRERIRDFVKASIEAQLGRQLGSDESYRNVDNNFIAIVGLFDNMEYTGSVGDLFMIINLACCLSTEGQKPLMPKNVIREALAGKANALEGVRSQYMSLAKASVNNISRTELDAMKLVLDIYNNSTKGKFDSALRDVKTKNSIRAAQNSTKHYRILSNALRDRWEDAHNPKPLEVKEPVPEVRLNFNDKFCKRLEQRINQYREEHGQDPLDLMDTLMRFNDELGEDKFVSLDTIAIAIYETVVNGKEPNLWHTGDISDDAVPFVTNIIEWLFRETNSSQSLRYSAIRNILVESGDRSVDLIKSTYKNAPNRRKVIIDAMKMMRKHFSVEHANFNTEALLFANSTESVTVSDDSEYYKQLANNECDIAFSAIEIRRHAANMAHSIIDYAEDMRWDIYHELERRAQNPKATPEQKLKWELAMNDLTDDVTWLKAALRFLLKSPKIDGQRYDNIFEYAKTSTIGNAKETELGQRLENHWRALELRGLAELEAMTGQRIILNAQNEFEVKDSDELETNDEDLEDTGMSEQEKREESDLEHNHDKTNADFRDNVDPYSTLTVNVRLKLSRIPQLDKDGNHKVDPETGNKLYFDPKFVFNSLLELVSSRMITSKDFYEITQSLDDGRMWSKYIPGFGLCEGVSPTSEAFPLGYPKFPLLEKVAAAQPWAKGLIDVLTKSYMDMGVGSGTDLGQFVTDLCSKLTFCHAERVKFTKEVAQSGSRKKSNITTINRLGSVDSVRAVQRLQYFNNGIGYADEHGLISSEAGKMIKEAAQELEERNAVDVFMTRDSDTIMAFCDDVADILNRLGYDIKKGYDNPFYMEMMVDGNLDAASGVEFLVSMIKNFGEVYEGEPNQPTDDTVYENHDGVWEHLHQAVGRFVSAEFFQLITTENGVSRQNMIAASTFTKIMDTIGYGWKAMSNMSKDRRGPLLEERRRRIDEEYGHLKTVDENGHARYENTFLQAMYDGKDIPDDPARARAGAKFWGGFALLNNYDDIEFTKLDDMQRLELMLAAYLKQDEFEAEGDQGKGGAMFFTPTLGDTKAAVLTRGKQRSRKECVSGMARFIRDELKSIAHNKMVANRWCAVWATEHGSLNKHAFLHPKTGRWTRYDSNDVDWRAAAIIKKYRDGSAEEKLQAQEEWENLRKDNDLSTLEEAVLKYVAYLDYQPTGTFFKQEQQINRLRRLNKMKLSVRELIDRQVQRSVEKGMNTEEGARAYYEEQARIRFGEDHERMVTIFDIYDAYADILDDQDLMSPEEFKEDYAALTEIFTEEAMERQYQAQVAPYLQDEWTYREKVNLHRIECIINGVADYKGIEWELAPTDTIAEQRDENGELVTTKYIRDKNNHKRRRELTEKEYEYYLARQRGEYSSPTSEFKGDDGVHKISTLRDFRPAFKNHGDLLKMLRTMKGQPNMDFNKVHDYIKDMFYNSAIHNEELMEILKIDPKFFKGTRDLTKRLRGVMANGSGVDFQVTGGREVEHIIVYKDDVANILPDYPNIVAAYRREAAAQIEEINKRDISKADKEAAIEEVVNALMAKIEGHSMNNATNAQGYELPGSYIVSGREGGSQHMNPRIFQTINDAVEGKQELDPKRFKPDSAPPAQKTNRFDTMQRVDPEGGVHWVPVYTKDTEVVIVPPNEALGSPRSARQMALYQALDNVSFVTEDGEEVQIDTIVSEEAMKSTHSGVVDMRYLQSRVDAVKKLLSGERTAEDVAAEFMSEMDNVVKKVKETATNDGKSVFSEEDMTAEDFIDFVKKMKTFIELCAQEAGRDPQYLTFDEIDGYIHNGSGRIEGLSGRSRMWLKNEINEAHARERIQELMNMRLFFMPVKSTEKTVSELRDRNITGALRKTNGKLNESYVYKARTSRKKFQLRFSNHSVDGKSNLGSQESYIIPTAIDLKGTYTVGGREFSGTELLDLFNKCLAVRLFHGIADIKELFDNTPEAMKKLQERIASIAQNNMRFGEDVINAIQIVRDALEDGTEGEPRFNTPLSSVGIIYKLSDVLTSFVRSTTHRRKINGTKVIVEGDIGYDDRLRLVRDPNTGNIVGIECYLPATMRKQMELCIVEKEINGQVVRVLDPQKLKEAGLSEIIAYRIPTEDLHSILPLIVKGFREQVHSGSIVVAGEVTTLTGGDNDGDGLFIMLKNIDPDTDKAYEYDWDKPMKENNEEAVENLLIDIIKAVVTHPSNETRFFSPQNPDTLKTVSRRIAYAKLPNELKLRRRVARRNDDGNVVKLPRNAQYFEYVPEDPEWDDKEIFQRVEDYREIEKIPYDVISDHINELNEEPVTSIFTVIETGLQQALAKSGVAIASDGMAIYEKLLVALRIIGGYAGGVSFEGDEHLPLGIRWNNGKTVSYCAETDINGTPIFENVNNYLAALVDSAKDLFTILIGLNEHNAAFAGFLLRCGFSPEMMSYAIAFMNKHDGLPNKYMYGIAPKLFGEGNPIEEDIDLGKISPDALKKALSMDVVTAKTLNANRDVLAVVHSLTYLYRCFNDMHSYEGTTKYNSVKNGLTNEAASAVYKILQVRHVLGRIRKGEKGERGGYPVALTEQMAIHPNLDFEDDVMNGTFIDDNGATKKIAMPLSQMYFTSGIESFTDLAGGHLFYASPAYLKLCIGFEDVIMNMPQEDAIKFMKRLHDEWMTFTLSDMNMVTHLTSEEGEEVETDFVKMRNFYKVQFPKNWANDALYPKDALSRFAICKKLTYDKKSGKLTLGAELRNEAFTDEVKQSLIDMANDEDPQVRKLAVDLFLYSYFSDGLRFGPNSISNTFTSKFLATDAFKEYNERVAALCKMPIPGQDMMRFLQQFTIAHAVDYQFGKLLRLGNSEVNKEGKPVKVDLVEDEVSQQEVCRLEEYLAHPDSEGEICLDPSGNLVLSVTDRRNPTKRKAERDLELPLRIMKKASKLKNGELLRIQTGPSLYHQNTYMVFERNGQKYLRKVHDFLNGIAYNKAYDLDTLARMNTEGNPLEEQPGNFDNPGKQAVRDQRARKDTLLGKKLIQRKGDSEEGNGPLSVEDQIKKMQEQMSMPTGMPAGMPMGPIEGMPLFNQAPSVLSPIADELGLDTEEKKEPEEKKEKFIPRKNDKSRRISVERWSYMGEEEDDIMPHISTGTDPVSDSSEEAKAQALRDAGADGTFRTEHEAVMAAHKVKGYTPNVKRNGSSYTVELFDSNDEAANDTWIDQYGRTIMEGQDGLNDTMNEFGNTDVDFIDTHVGYEDYDTVAQDIIKMLDAAMAGDALPDVSKITAKGIVGKLIGTSSRMAALEGILEDMVRNGTGALTNEEFITLFSDGSDDERAAHASEMVSRISTPDADESEAAVNEQVRAILETCVSNPKLFKERIAGYIAANDSLDRQTKKNLNWVLGKIDQLFIENTLLPELNRVMHSRAETLRDRIKELANRADVAQSYNTPEEQRRMDENSRNALRTQRAVQKLKKFIENALVMEERKRKMAIEEKQKPGKIDARIEILKGIVSDDGRISLHGILRYLESVSKEYDRWSLFFGMLSNGTANMSHQEALGRLATVSKVLKSHEGILQELTDLINSEFPEKNMQFSMSDGTSLSLNDLVGELSRLHIEMRQRFLEHAPKEVIGFIKDFTGESYAMKNADGTHVTWEQLFYDKHGDITWADEYLRSMGRTKDPIGGVIDTITKMQKDLVRRRTIMDQQTRIRDLYVFCEREGITDFEFAFEHDEDGNKTGYYVSEVRSAAFYEEHEKQRKLRDDVLNDDNSTEQQRLAAKLRYEDWVSENGNRDTETGFVYPSPTKAGGRWKNPEWDEVQRDQKKREFLEKFKAIKKDFDLRLGSRTAHERAIQRRMTSEQRFKTSFTLNPKKFWENLKRKLAEDFLVREDDYMEAGERSAVLDFDGTPRMLTPAPYVRMLKNPNELSTDLIGCLMAYSYATNNYVAMREITAPLEVMFEALVDNKVTYDEHGGRVTVEHFTHSKKQKAVVSASRFFTKLRSYLDSQLYMRYNQDEEDVFTLFNRQFRKSKAAAAFLHMSATAQLGFNFLVDMASLANGLLQTNIEAAARRYFSGSALRKADAAYWAALKDFLPDLARPFKESKLALVSQALDIQQNFDLKLYNNARHQLLQRLFNTNIAFLGTTGGNHWLYHRVAIAMMMETKVTYIDQKTGKKVTTNLWDAFQTAEVGGGGKIAKLPHGTTTIDGELIDEKWLYKLGERIDGVNHDLVGIYNRDDMNMAQKVWYGKLLMAFHKHIVPLYDRRWRGKHYDKNLERDVQGYMLTLGEFLKGIRNAQFNVAAAWEDLDEEQRQDVRAALTDIIQFAALLMLSGLVLHGDDDDDEETRLKKVCKYLISRETHEMGSFINPLSAGKEIINILNNPVAGTSQLEDIYNFAHTAATPWTWGETVKAGPFQGQSQLEMRTRKLPIPILSYYRNIDKSLNGIDNSTWFYNRGYAGNV